MKRFILIATVLAAAICSCKSQYELLLEGNDTDAKMAAAFEYFENGKYSKAATLFESMAIVVDGTERGDTVNYYWGLSNYRNRDYVTAEANFTKFLSNYPNSPFEESAEYLRIDCLYRSTLRYELDQTPTYTAITAISQYISAHPEGQNAESCRFMLQELGERLDRKAYENAKIYYTLEDYQAARVALKNVLKDDADNIYREDILYYSAMASYKYADMSISQKQKERFLIFADDYFTFIGEYPESGYRKELDHLYNKIKEKI